MLATAKEPNCAQSFIWPDLILFYNLIIYSQCALLWHIHGERERERERERESAFVYNIFLCTWSSVRTCVWCRSMRVNVFVKLWLVLTFCFICRTFYFIFCSFLLLCNFNIIYKCVCAVGGGVGHACRCMSEWVSVCVCVCARARFLLLLNSYSALS